MSRTARLGLFVFFALAVLAAGVFIIGSKEYLFRRTYKLKTQFDNVAGLEVGADVEVGGVHSGTVRAIDLPRSSHGKVTVLMDLDQGTHGIIKKDSIATIETAGVLGSQFMAISFGGDGEVKDGDTIQSAPPLQMADLLKKASGIMDSGKVAMDNTTKITEHLKDVSARIDSGQGTVGALINDKELYNNLQQSSSSLNTTLVHAQAGVTDFEENMEALKHNFLLKGYFKKRGYEDSNELTANNISALPTGTPLKTFSFSGKQIFGGKDSAQMKNEKTLNAAGDYLTHNQFGAVVIVASTGMEGDTQKDLQLSQARAMLVREYLVNNFEFDDTQVKTLGQGKQDGRGPDADWGSVQVLIFPTGTEIPTDKETPANNISQSGLNQKAADIKQP